MKRIKRIIVNGLFGVLALSGLFQFFLIPGMIWNLVFPYLQLLLLFLSLKWIGQYRLIKNCALVILIFTLCDIGLSALKFVNLRSPKDPTELSLMSYNVFFRNQNPNASIDLIKKYEPDVLFIQELTPKWEKALDKSLGSLYKFRGIYPLKGTHGIGIYSKFRLGEQELLMDSFDRPYAQMVDLKIGDKNLKLINTHLASPAIAVENPDRFLPLFVKNYQRRKKQLKRISDEAKRESQGYDGLLLVGDMNTLYSEPIFKRLKLNWVHSVGGMKRWTKFNFPNSSRIPPLLTLDHFLARGRLKFLDSKVVKGGSSDHLAIVVTLKV